MNGIIRQSFGKQMCGKLNQEYTILQQKQPSDTKRKLVSKTKVEIETRRSTNKISATLMGYANLGRKKNVQVREHLNVPSVVTEIGEYQRNLLKHLQRMNNNRRPLPAFKYRPAGRRNSGRPSMRWKNELHFKG
jgi:hypothetical protein